MAAVVMNVKRWAGLVLLGVLTLTLPGSAWASGSFQLTPDLVRIGAFYEGVEVSLKGEIPPGAQAVVEIIGAATQEELLRKGRRVGLWMTVGEIRVADAPNLYLVLSSTPKLPQLAGQEAAWGFPALQQKIKFQGDLVDREREQFFKEFLELKESEMLYGSLPGTLKISQGSSGQAALTGKFFLPAKVPPGTYQVRLSVIQEGRVAERRQAELKVRMVGFPALLASMAYQHSAFYGIAAVLIAIATGFIMGFLFKGKTEH